MSYITEFRTPEQKSRKMLREEMVIMQLEMAIKKEQFRDKQKIKPQFREILVEDEDPTKSSDLVNETNDKITDTLNKFLHKIRF